jgi:hypothetical protein
VAVQAVEPSVAPTPTQDASTLSVLCGDSYIGDAASLDVTFGYSVNAYAPYKIKIDYGDGHTYTNDYKHLDQIFRHRYKVPGRHTVTATLLKDHAGFTAKSTCAWEWTTDAPVAPAAVNPDPGTMAFCSDGTVTNSAGQQGACSWHGGLMNPSDSTGASGKGGGSTWVTGYTRSDGTYVSGYYRSK